MTSTTPGYAAWRDIAFADALDAIGWPIEGDRDRWRWWLARSLDRLEARGWFDASPDTAEDQASHLALTVFALRWIAEDAGEALDPYAEGDADWYDWVRHLELAPDGPLPAARASAGWAGVEAEAEDQECPWPTPSDIDTEDRLRDAVRDYLDTTWFTLRVRSVVLVAGRLRRALAPELTAAWGGPDRLFRAFYAVLRADAAAVDADTDPASDMPVSDLPLTFAHAAAVNAAADDALDPDNGLGEKLALLDWVAEGLPVRVRGTPE